VKLADFGLAKEGVTEATVGANSLCGTPEYLSPEVLDRQGHGYAVDWWNLGMVVYEMLTGLPPWYTTEREKLFQRLRTAPLKFPFYVSRTAASFIHALLNRRPHERLGSNGGGAEVCKHPFFNQIDFDALLRKEIRPPINPCVEGDEEKSANFENEFKEMAISLDAQGQSELASGMGQAAQSHDRLNFENFTYEEESAFEQMRTSFAQTEKEERRQHYHQYSI
jgi:serine/threonine protein kinase